MTSDTRYAAAVLEAGREQTVRVYSSRRIIVIYSLVIAAYALLFTFWQAEPVPWNVHLLAMLVAATCFAPIALWYARGGQGLPMFELICVSYALQFSMPVYTQPNWLTIYSRQVPVRWSTVAEVLLLVEFGVAAMVAAYYLVRHSPIARSLPTLDLPLIRERRSVYLWCALAGGGLLRLLQVLGWGFLASPEFASVVRLMTSQYNVAIVLLAYVVYGGEEQGALVKSGLFVAVAFGFVVGLMTGMLEHTLMPLVLVLTVRWHATRRIPWFAILVGFVLYLVLNPAKFEYRQQVWFSGEEYGASQRLAVWAGAVEDELSTASQEENWELTVQQALARFDLVHRFAYVRDMTPAFIPFYRGETYSYFLYAWVPRVLWPDKPSASEAVDRMDIDYGFKYETQPVTVAMGQLPEAYANFGALGIGLVMALQGIIFALLDALLNGRRSDGGRAIYLVIMAYFLNGIGSSAAILFGALIQYVVASALILRPFASSWRAAGTRLANPDGTPELAPASSDAASRGSD